MYYDDLLTIINEFDKFTDGIDIKKIYEEQSGGGSVINMNKALRKLRIDKKVKWKKKGVRIFYKRL
jgi:hypothetical protein